MTTSKRKRRSAKVADMDHVWRAVFLGDDCPEGVNPFVFLDYPFVLTNPELRASDPTASEALREAWPRLRAEVLREWRRRKRTGLPPGAVLDGKPKSTPKG